MALSSNDVAERLGISRQRVLQLAKQGRIEGAKKVGRDWVFEEPVSLLPGERGPKSTATNVKEEMTPEKEYKGARERFEDAQAQYNKMLDSYFPVSIVSDLHSPKRGQVPTETSFDEMGSVEKEFNEAREQMSRAWVRLLKEREAARP